jgi:type I restriction-modification system DNA methylase subunit
MNEQKTEAIVRDLLRKNSYYDLKDIIIEEQRSDNPRIDKLLKNASKRGNGCGLPEFIIYSNTTPDFIIIVECKARTINHISKTLDRYADYAVDGALLYASFLSKQFDVLAIAASGENKSEFRLSHYLHLKNTPKATEFTAANSINSLKDYYGEFLKTGVKFRQDYDALLGYSRELNSILQTKKIKEANRGFLISGILIALKNNAFKNSFRSHQRAQDIAKSLITTIESEFENANLPEDRRANLTHAFSFIGTAHGLIDDRDFFVKLIEDIDLKINSFMKTHRYYDTIAQFYIEFLRYANNDKGLGIVLTPPHVAELFSDIADVNKNSIVFDNCTGTAGLLIAAMKAMIKDANGNSDVENRIKSKQLFGIEFQDDIYALAVSNMVLHGDGKTNVLRGNCFTDTDGFVIRNKPNVGLLNPPYKGEKNEIEELAFVVNNLEALVPDGKCIAIVPITCATKQQGKIYEWKRKILEGHTLEAVMSMPIELFHNSDANVVTCVMVITAKRPHPKGKKTWFGYWRNDGFVKTKHRGRVDLNGTWEEIRKHWINSYKNKEIVSGLSVMKEVTAADEWCAEAYMEPDWGTFDEKALAKTFKEFASYKILNTDVLLISGIQKDLKKLIPLKIGEKQKIGKLVPIFQLFNVSYGSSYELNHLEEREDGIAFVSRTSRNNGISARVEQTTDEPTPAGCLTVALGGSVLEVFLQDEPTYQGRDVDILIPKNPMTVDEKLWYATAIRQHQFRFSFGRQANKVLKELLIPLCPDNFK